MENAYPFNILHYSIFFLTIQLLLLSHAIPPLYFFYFFTIFSPRYTRIFFRYFFFFCHLLFLQQYFSRTLTFSPKVTTLCACLCMYIFFLFRFLKKCLFRVFLLATQHLFIFFFCLFFFLHFCRARVKMAVFLKFCR